jgi:hypothetical protein
MLQWSLRLLPLVLISLLLGEYLATPKPGSDRALLASLTQELRFTYHECVPLGWKPVPVRGTYYPGYTASAATYAEFLDAVWRGHVAAADLRSPDAAAVFAVLNHLRAAGLLTRNYRHHAYDFYLTPRAYPYYYGSSVFKDNHDSLPYLCYSTITPERILWKRAIAAPQSARGSGAQWYHVQFTWKPAAPAAWARDAFLRAHSVVLAPVASPTEARLYYENQNWYLANIYDRGWMLPALVTDLGQTPR